METSVITGGTITGVVHDDFCSHASRLYVKDHQGLDHDCVLDAVVSLALQQGHINIRTGDQLRVTVEVIGHKDIGPPGGPVSVATE